MNLPPYRPSMATIFRIAGSAIRAHWKTHNNAYHQKLVLTPEQVDDLVACQLYGQVAFPGAIPPRRDMYMGRPIEMRHDTLGEIVAHDGTSTPLSSYDATA